MLEKSQDPSKLLEERQGEIIKMIGEENRDCLKVFKYIISSTSTPIHAKSGVGGSGKDRVEHWRTKSMQTPQARPILRMERPKP